MASITRADLIHDLADVLHQTRLSFVVDGVLPIETPGPLPSRRDREQATEIVDRLIELRVLRGASTDDPAPPELVAR